jgi:hypothetical protein
LPTGNDNEQLLPPLKPCFRNDFKVQARGTCLATPARGKRSSGDRRIEGLSHMSVSSVGASSNAYAYLQSLLPQQGSTSSSADPLTELLAAFYPAGGGNPSGSASTSTTAAATTSSSSGPPCPTFSPDTLGALISLQGQQAGASDPLTAQTQSLFAQFDANGDGSISKTEFESAFGSNADMSKVDGLFNALDSNGDGSISLDELTSAARQAHGHHHHGHAHGVGDGQGGGLADLLSATDVAGATSQTATNSDGSTTTTISYADGTQITMTVPAASSTGSSSSAGSDSQTSSDSNNIIEQLIRLQSQMLAQSAGTIATTTLTTV